jgi:hypothetical protein
MSALTEKQVRALRGTAAAKFKIMSRARAERNIWATLRHGPDTAL